MNIAFILVNMFSGVHHDAMQPIIFAIIAQHTPPGVELHFFDERIRPLPDDIQADVVALSVDSFSAARAYQLAQEFRHRGIPVIMGGIHPSSAPDEALQHADAIIIGEAEDTWPKLIQDLQSGHLQAVYQSQEPALTGFDPRHPALQKGYLPLGLMETSRGCNHHCDFCSVKVLYPGKVRRKTLERVDWELSRSRHKLLFFCDDNLFSNRDYIIHLARLLRKHKKRWAAQVSIEVARDPQLLRIAKQSGAVLLLVGLESLYADALSEMNKRQNRASELAVMVRNIQNAGMLVYGTFVFGYDSDSVERVEEVYRFGMELGLSVLNFNPLQPMPGTPLYHRLSGQARLKSDAWWLDPSYRYGQMAFEPRSVAAEDLSQAIAQARKNFYRLGNTWRRWRKHPRRWDLSLAGLHFLLNQISRREIARKHDRSLHETDAD